MAEISTTKIEAARRQLDVAIRMHFENDDAFAIHTLAAAAQRILRDIADRRGGSSWHDGMKRSIRPGMENEFWSALNKPSNFLKHADKDPDPEGMLTVEDKINDMVLVSCCSYYESLGAQRALLRSQAPSRETPSPTRHPLYRDVEPFK